MICLTVVYENTENTENNICFFYAKAAAKLSSSAAAGLDTAGLHCNTVLLVY